MMGLLRYKLLFALLYSAIICIHNRSPPYHPVHEVATDITLGTTKGRVFYIFDYGFKKMYLLISYFCQNDGMYCILLVLILSYFPFPFHSHSIYPHKSLQFFPFHFLIHVFNSFHVHKCYTLLSHVFSLCML